MNDYLLAVILGVVEGVTEFLPISSTAHLRIAQHYLGISLENEYWKLFAVFIQLGAILSVVVLYRGRILSFLKSASALRRPADLLKHPIGLILLAFVFTAVPAFLSKKIIGQNLENLQVMVAAMFVGGVVMFVVDKFCVGKVNRLEEITPATAIFIGLVQTLSAIFPGTSRSMSTIAAAQMRGLSRSVALDFSFLLSIPIMVVATLYDLFKYRKELKAAGAQLDLSIHQIGVLALGFLISFLVAYVVVAWFLDYVKNKGFTPFAIYRILLAVILLLLL